MYPMTPETLTYNLAATAALFEPVATQVYTKSVPMSTLLAFKFIFDLSVMTKKISCIDLSTVNTPLKTLKSIFFSSDC